MFCLKRCEYNKDEDNSLKTLNDKNHQALSQKLKQLNILYCITIYYIICSLNYIAIY